MGTAVNVIRFFSLPATGSANRKDRQIKLAMAKNKNIKNQTLKPCDLHSSCLLATCIPSWASKSCTHLTSMRDNFSQYSNIGLETSSILSQIHNLCRVRVIATYNCFSSEHKTLCFASSKFGNDERDLQSTKSMLFIN